MSKDYKTSKDVLTVRKLIEILSGFKDQDMPCFIDCHFCGKSLEMKELATVVIMSTTTIHPK